MSDISAASIKALREETGLSVMQCRKALEDAQGDATKAKELLAKQGAVIAAKKGDRTLGAGAVVSYIHATGTIGVMLELSCETDFVAKNPEFKQVAYDIAMHISAMRPADNTELLTQEFIKDPSKTIQDLVNGAVQKFGERTEVRRFVRYSVAE
jgi:elongation factor Ts